jgi:CBS domain-containing protein/anti-sigma regulatory factor (Ser/Thr protein kinase)
MKRVAGYMNKGYPDVFIKEVPEINEWYHNDMVENKSVSKVQELVYELNVEQVMTTKVVTVSPQKLMSELRELLRVHRISGVPVVEGDKLVGLVSIEDFIKCLADGEMHRTVAEKMIRKVTTLYPDEPLIYAIEKFEQTGFGRFLVVDRANKDKLVGILTKGNIVEGLLRKLEIHYHEDELRRYRASHIFSDIIADNTTLVFQYDVRGDDFIRAGECASRLKKTLTRLGFHPELTRRLGIATYEAEMNIVVFTPGGEITAKVNTHHIVVEAVDAGPGIPDIEQAMQPGFSTAPLRIRELGFGAGMGLNNIQRCTDWMHIDSTVGKGTKVQMIINLVQTTNHDSTGTSSETGVNSPVSK